MITLRDLLKLRPGNRERIDQIKSEMQRDAMCEECGCWTGGADCPYCTDAPHPRGRW